MTRTMRVSRFKCSNVDVQWKNPSFQDMAEFGTSMCESRWTWCFNDVCDRFRLLKLDGVASRGSHVLAALMSDYYSNSVDCSLRMVPESRRLLLRSCPFVLGGHFLPMWRARTNCLDLLLYPLGPTGSGRCPDSWSACHGLAGHLRGAVRP
jgi:hypothetical protein